MFELNFDFPDMKYVFVTWYGNKQSKQCFSKNEIHVHDSLDFKLGSLYIAFYPNLTVCNTPPKQKR